MKTTTIFVHGFGYPEESKDRADLYDKWAKGLLRDDIIRFGYYSYPVGAKHVWRAWKEGYWNRYYAAWARAKKEGANLRRIIQSSSFPVDIVCHSLGSRVVLEALKTYEVLPVHKVLILSGSDSIEHAAEAVHHITYPIEFLSVVVPDEKVLPLLGRVFTPTFGLEDVIGYDGFEHKALLNGYPYWNDLYLPTADNHWAAYDEKYWPLYRDWFNGRMKL